MTGHTRFRHMLGVTLFNRSRTATWLFLVGVFAMAALALPHLAFDDEVQRGFASDSAHSTAYSALVRALPQRQRDVVVLVEAGAAMDAAQLGAVRDFTLDLALMDDVTAVVSPFSLRLPPTDAEAPNAPVFANEIDAAEAYRRLDDLESRFTGLPRLITPDRQAAIAMVALEKGLSADAVRDTLGEIRAAAANLGEAGLSVTVTGEDAIAVEIVDALKTDLLLLNAIGASLAIALSLYIFRGLRWALVAFLPAGLSALVALAVFALLGYPVTVLNVVVPLLVLVLALADSIHLTGFFLSLPADAPVGDRIARTFATIAPANAMTSLTTAIGFGAIAVSGFEQLDELALLGAVSILAACFVVSAAFAALAPLAAGHTSHTRISVGVPAAVANWALGRSRLVLVTAGVVAIGSIAAITQTEPWFPLYQNLPGSSEVRRAHRAVEARFGGYMRLWFEIDRTPGVDPIDKVRAVTSALAQAAPGRTVLSAATLADWRGETGSGIPPALFDDAPAALAEMLAGADGRTDRVVALVPEPMHDRATRDLQDRMVEAALAAGADRVVGAPMILRHDSLEVVHQLGRGLLIACLITTAFIALVLRSARLLPVIALPNLLPIGITTAALLPLEGGLVNPTAVLALTVAFGVAVDDTIHFLNRYLAERGSGAAVADALSTSIRETGRAMIATTLVISAGLAATLISDFSTVRLFGTMLIMTFATALAADLLVLPAMLRTGWWR